MTGSAHALPVDDGSHDAVFAHAALYRLSDPARALREFWRVLAPGGLVAVRDTDYSLWDMVPATPGLRSVQDRVPRAQARRGASGQGPGSGLPHSPVDTLAPAEASKISGTVTLMT